MYENEDREDLKGQIYGLKKQLMKVNSENYLLKVKVRKLEDQVEKKQKQIGSLIDHTNHSSSNIGKIVYEHSASYLINTKKKNDNLIELLKKKDAFIKHLKKQLDVVKLYSVSARSNAELGNCEKIMLNIPISEDDDAEEQKDNLRRGRSTSGTSGFDSPIPIKDQYKELPRGHLLSIIENLKNNQRQSPSPLTHLRSNSSRKSSPNSDLELFCDSPHEEIQQLQSDFLDMVCEVEKLKNMMSGLQLNSAPHQKKNNKRPKSEKSRKFNNNNAVVARIYKCKSAKDSSKGHGHSIRSEMKKHYNSLEEDTEKSVSTASFLSANTSTRLSDVSLKLPSHGL